MKANEFADLALATFAFPFAFRLNFKGLGSPTAAGA